jgi:hypothetical protein
MWFIYEVTAMNDDVNEPSSVRVRVTLSPVMVERIEMIAKTLGISTIQATTTALAFGLRMLDMSIVNPIDTTVRAAMETRLTNEVESVAKETGVSVR